MEVILLERIERLGQMGDVVALKPGYARNDRLPAKKARGARKAIRRMIPRPTASRATAVDRGSGT